MHARRRPTQRLGDLGDERLVELASRGDEGAFAEIVRRYRPRLLGYCRKVVSASVGEDVVQDTFARAWLHLRHDPRPLALSAWLHRVAHNLALNHLARRDNRYEELHEGYDGVPQPPRIVDQREQLASLVGGLHALPDRQRDAVVQFAFEGRSYAEIADRLNCSGSVVRGLIERARKGLRAGLPALVPIPFGALLPWRRARGYDVGARSPFGNLAASMHVAPICNAANTFIARAATTIAVAAPVGVAVPLATVPASPHRPAAVAVTDRSPGASAAPRALGRPSAPAVTSGSGVAVGAGAQPAVASAGPAQQAADQPPPDTVAATDSQSANAADASAAAAYNGAPSDPNAGQPNGGQPGDPTAGQPADPTAGQPVDPTAGQPVDPTAGQPADPPPDPSPPPAP